MSTVLLSTKPEPLFKLILTELKKAFPEYRLMLKGRDIKKTDEADWLIYNYRDWVFYKGKDYQFHRPTILVDDQFKIEELPLLDCPDNMTFHISGDFQGISEACVNLFELFNKLPELTQRCQGPLNDFSGNSLEHVWSELPHLIDMTSARAWAGEDEFKKEMLILAPTFIEKKTFFSQMYLNRETVKAENEKSLAFLKCVQACDYFLVFNVPQGQLLYVAQQKVKKVANNRARRKVIGLH